MNNVSSAMQNAGQPVQTVTALSYGWRLAIEEHYQSLKQRIPHQRQDRIAQAFGCTCHQGAKRYILPASFPDSPSHPLPAKWAGRQADKMECLAFLSETAGISEGVLKNTIFPDRVRPAREQLVKLLGSLHLYPQDEPAQLRFGETFGWHMDEASSLTLETRKKRLEALLKDKWGLTSLNAAAAYLDLSSSTMDNVKTEWNQHVSTAYKFIIALGSPEDPLELYHLFRLHPIEIDIGQKTYYGEECGIVKACLDVFDALHRKLYCDQFPDQRIQAESGSAEFFDILKTILIYYDQIFGKKLYGKLVSQQKEGTAGYQAPLPTGKE